LFSKEKKEAKAKQRDKKLLANLEEKYNSELTDLHNLMVSASCCTLQGTYQVKGVKNKFNEEVIPRVRSLPRKTISALKFLDIIPSTTGPPMKNSTKISFPFSGTTNASFNLWKAVSAERNTKSV
jgi:hypothetical protein